MIYLIGDGDSRVLAVAPTAEAIRRLSGGVLEFDGVQYVGSTLVASDARGLVGDYYGDGAFISPLAPQKSREQLKAEREAAAEAIVVTTAAGNIFDGDEASQTRLARTIVALQTTGLQSVTWVLHNNTTIDATVAELAEALALASAELAELWVI